MDDLETTQTDTPEVNSSESVESAPEVQSSSGEPQSIRQAAEKLFDDMQSGKAQTQTPQTDKTVSQILDLDSLGKFKYKGKEMTLKDLEKGFMLESDYRAKTMELGSQRKYLQALQHDLPKLRQDPSLIDEFKKIYPKEFHSLVDLLDNSSHNNVGAAQTNQSSGAQANQTASGAQANQIRGVDGNSQYKDPRVDEVYNWVQEQRVQTATVQVNAIFDKFSAKYPEADERVIVAEAMRLNRLHKEDPDSHAKPDEKVIEELFKSSQEDRVKFAKTWQSKQFESQKKANERGKGPGIGGAIPGGAPKEYKTIKEAAEAFIRDQSLG